MTNEQLGADPVLIVDCVSKQYGSVRALSDVSLTVAPSEVRALLGQNGAGKSTLVRIVAGAEIPSSGSLVISGDTMTANDPDTALKHRIAYVSQEGNLNPNFTVPENVFLGREQTRWRLLEKQNMRARVATLLEEFELSLDLRRPVAELNPSKRKLAEIVRALALRPRLLVLDEPTAALPPPDVEQLLGITRQLAATGIAVLFISHYLDEVFSVANTATVLRDGRVTWDGGLADTDPAQLIHAMVGKEVTRVTRETTRATDEAPVLQVKDLSTKDSRVQHATLSAQSGRIRGIFGVVGAGKSELLEALFGIRSRASGSIAVRGANHSRWNPGVAIRNGLALVPEDRNKKALLGDYAIAWNVSMPYWKRLSRFLDIARREADLGRDVVRNLDIKAPSHLTPVHDLSGGNKQKVSIGRWLGGHATAQIFLFDEPTQGLDVGARAEVYRLMRNLADNGAAVIVASSDVEEIVSISDDISVIRDGISRDLPSHSSHSAADVLGAAA